MMDIIYALAVCVTLQGGDHRQCNVVRDQQFETAAACQRYVASNPRYQINSPNGFRQNIFCVWQQPLTGKWERVTDDNPDIKYND